MKSKIFLFVSLIVSVSRFVNAQDSLDLLIDSVPQKQYVTSAFKSSRVIMSHSIELLKPGVLDFRILHRFGNINQGIEEFFGLDEATIRLGLDYGISNRLTIGIGRSSYKKEVDGFIKFKALQQSTGSRSMPLSVVVVGGSTVQTAAWTGNPKDESFTNRLSHYGQLILGRKFNDVFTLQAVPTIVHRNLVHPSDPNNTFAIGAGGRIRMSRRVSLTFDYYAITNKDESINTYNPLSIGFDIETGGHVFQLHFTNAVGMNERAFITETTNQWSQGDIQFGFNISRAFQLKKKKLD